MSMAGAYCASVDRTNFFYRWKREARRMWRQQSITIIVFTDAERMRRAAGMTAPINLTDRHIWPSGLA